MSIAERISILSKFEGSHTRLAEKIGRKPQIISRIIKQGTEVRSDTILAIAEAYPNLSMQWFIAGRGEMWLEENVTPMTNTTPADEEGLKDEIITLQKARIKMLEEQIRLKDAEWGKGLGVE